MGNFTNHISCSWGYTVRRASAHTEVAEETGGKVAYAMKRLALPTRPRSGHAGRFDTWSDRARNAAAGLSRRAHTPHTVQLMPIRIAVIRPQRSLRGLIRKRLVDLGLICGTGAVTYYLTRHPDKASATRRRITSTGRGLIQRHTPVHHPNGAGDPNAAATAIPAEPVTV